SPTSERPWSGRRNLLSATLSQHGPSLLSEPRYRTRGRAADIARHQHEAGIVVAQRQHERLIEDNLLRPRTSSRAGGQNRSNCSSFGAGLIDFQERFLGNLADTLLGS